MAKALPDDILIPSGGADQRPSTSRVAAFIPISVAIAGVAAILFGGVVVQDTIAGDIDPMVTGSIKPAPLAPVGEIADVR
jgi:hypothetical protein